VSVILEMPAATGCMGMPFGADFALFDASVNHGESTR
jgi:lysozyme family protein